MGTSQYVILGNVAGLVAVPASEPVCIKLASDFIPNSKYDVCSMKSTNMMYRTFMAIELSVVTTNVRGR